MNFWLENGVPFMMQPSLELRINEYNRLVVQCQDDAFTLAFDLLGDEVQASEVVDGVFRDAFGRRDGSVLDFHLEIYRRVIAACRKQTRTFVGPGIIGIRAEHLSNEEKTTLILVDRLKLNYSEAARVLQKPADAVRKMLACARLAFR